ncbi:MAG: tRNA (adenosine(37)-N6)-dimethylallyltransferase MiaA [Alphaproteobacteria bacterium]|nr:tRNA (adenosine(37)-N6)-dimethylallyltransferase MiaA [Alphaproteobacteria bacterium]
MKIQSIIIAGPTASGKSDFAHKLALSLNGAIINCDSVQIYKGIEAISASPFAGHKSIEEFIEGVPYKLFSILPLSEQLSVADYLVLAKKAYDEVLQMGRLPIFVGGSGYYINVLINGISPIPEVKEDVRMRARSMIKDDMKEVDNLLPDYAHLDPQRKARALEVFLETGKTLKYWQNLPRKGALLKDAYKILINPSREVLLQRIAKRIPEMLDSTAMEEAQEILQNGLDDTRAIGATQLCNLLRGDISKEDAINNWIYKTNQYAKRQRTWYKNQYSADLQISNVPTKQDIDKVVKTIINQ